MKRPYGAKQPNAKQMADEPVSSRMRMADGGLVEADYDDAPLQRQVSGFLPPNSCDETQGPGVRSQQDYRK